LPSNGHYYQFIPSIGLLGRQQNTSENSLYYGLQDCYITAADEAKISGEQAGAGWIGGSDAATEGVWKWVTGPEGLAEWWNRNNFLEWAC
jgi:hypothetical protein